MQQDRIRLPAAMAGCLLMACIPVGLATEKGGSAAEQPSVAPVHYGSVESMIERRREQMKRRREQYSDARSGRRWRLPPWENAQQDMLDQRQDAIAEQFRRRRDALETQHDARGRWLHPRSQWNQDWSQARRDARELARLSRDEFREHWRYRRPPRGYAPYW